MTYEFNSGDAIADAVENPFKRENALLALSSFALIGGGVFVLLVARDLFGARSDKLAIVVLLMSSVLFGLALKFLIQALSQIRFFFGRKYPVGLASELQPDQVGLADGARKIVETLRHRAIDFPEPAGALNGILYSMIKPLITSPLPIQEAAIRQFQSLVGMMGLLISMAVTYVFCAGSTYEGMISWMYLPMCGLSLAAPFLPTRANEEDDRDLGKSDKVLWKLVGLVSFSVLAPVAVPRFMPLVQIAPMWIAPMTMLVTSVIASGLFLASLVAQLDTVQQTGVSCEQGTLAMNCHPAQLWPKLSRDMQNSWARNIPNRVYANVPPGIATVDRGAFQGYLLEETQPQASFSASSVNARDALGDRHVRFLTGLGVWGLVLSACAAITAAYFAPSFASMQRMEISRVILVIFGLSLSAAMSFRIGHLLWSRMYFTSRVVFVVVDGTFQNGEMRIGNQLVGNVQSRATVTRVEDATLQVWVADLLTVAFGKSGSRHIMALAPADSYAKAIADDLRMFAKEQSSITMTTSSRDMDRAKAVSMMNAAMGTGPDLQYATSQMAKLKEMVPQ